LNKPLASTEVRKTAFLQLRSNKKKFETMQTIEETLFANRKTKEKNARSNYPKIPLMTPWDGQILSTLISLISLLQRPIECPRKMSNLGLNFYVHVGL
jgi:CRISPR/Cas system CMR-associated protein Cmr3 (group 5 of RAMP superfamily)